MFGLGVFWWFWWVLGCLGSRFGFGGLVLLGGFVSVILVLFFWVAVHSWVTAFRVGLV